MNVKSIGMFSLHSLCGSSDLDLLADFNSHQVLADLQRTRVRVSLISFAESTSRLPICEYSASLGCTRLKISPACSGIVPDNDALFRRGTQRGFIHIINLLHQQICAFSEANEALGRAGVPGEHHRMAAVINAITERSA